MDFHLRISIVLGFALSQRISLQFPFLRALRILSNDDRIRLWFRLPFAFCQTRRIVMVDPPRAGDRLFDMGRGRLNIIVPVE